MEQEYEQYRLIKKQTRKKFSVIGWVLLIYTGIMNVAVFAVMIGEMAAKFASSLVAGNGDPMGVMMDQIPTGEAGYIVTVILGLVLLLLWKKPAYWKNEIFARGRPMKFGAFVQILCVFLAGQLIYQIIMTCVEMALNAFGLSVLAGMEAVSMDTDSFLMFLYGGILAPISEEILFRGFVQRTLMPYGKRFAILCSAFAFGIFHGNLLQAPFGFVVGLVLGYVACEYNIFWAMILHMVNNLVLGDMLYRLGDMIAPMAADYLTSALLLLAGIAAAVVLIVGRKGIRQYRKDNPIYGFYLGCFFSSPGNIVLMVLMAINMVYAMTVMITPL